MWVYAHTDYLLRGYSRLTHEPLSFERGQVYNVNQEIAEFLVGNHPYEFCLLSDGESAQDHARRCYLGGATYETTNMEAPPKDRMLQPRRRGRPVTRAMK